jgi:outer membrane protein
MQESGATEQQLQQKYQELQYRTQQYQQALQEDYTKKSDAIIQEVRELIGEFAKENSFDIVLFEQSVIFVSEKIDITERVKEYIANIEPKESTKE